MVSLTLPQAALQNWLRPERSGQVARIVNVLLVIWLAWLLAGLSWLIVPGGETAKPRPPAAAPAANAEPRKAHVDARQIADWHLFGIAGEDAPAPKAAAVDAPDTSLKLTLRGVFASNEMDRARAIVGDARGQENHYAVGDPLPGGARLAEVYPDRIILDRNGRYETLRLPKDRTSAVLSDIEPGAAVAGTATKAAAFTRYRNEIRQNPSAFLNYVRATPARGADGKFIGFRLQAGRERGALNELGLRPGDIVTSINGVQIDSPAKGMKAMQTLAEGDSVSVTLLRDGQESSLSLNVPASRK
jgi:general secretion pathway protein C